MHFNIGFLSFSCKSFFFHPQLWLPNRNRSKDIQFVITTHPSLVSVLTVNQVLWRHCHTRQEQWHWLWPVYWFCWGMYIEVDFLFSHFSVILHILHVMLIGSPVSKNKMF